MTNRILLMGSSYGIGLTFYFTRLALALKRKGHEVTVLSSNGNEHQNLSEELSHARIEHCLSNVIDNADPISIVIGVKKLRALIKKKGFDIIHAGGVRHLVKAYLATTFARYKEKPPKTLVSISALPMSKIGSIFARISYNSFVDNLIAISMYSKKEMELQGVDSESIEVIPLYTPDLTWFDEAKESHFQLDRYRLEDTCRPVVFYAGSHLWHKGFPIYLEAAAKILKKFDVTFVVGGSGPLTDTLKDLARRLKIYDRLIFTGRISFYHMPYILSNIADICVSTSLIEHLPRYLLECMAASKPIVATSVGGVPEIISNGVNGYLTSCNSDEIAERIAELLDDSKKARRMGLAGRKLVCNELNLEVSVSKLARIYDELTAC